MNQPGKDKRFSWRWLQEIIADSCGYFWSPCPLCGEFGGGHEWTHHKGLNYSPGRGTWICANCVDKAEEMNKKNADWIASQPHALTKEECEAAVKAFFEHSGINIR